MKKLLIINGPNLNLVGQREQEIYGSHTFEEYLKALRGEFGASEAAIDYYQSNVEGELIDAVQKAAGIGGGQKYDGIVLNAGGYTHTSVALADAVGAVAGMGVPTVEVHISNIADREEFRHTSYLTPRCAGAVMGFGLGSYRLAVLSFLQ